MSISVSDAADLDALLHDLPRPDEAVEQAARARQAQLTKPPGSLGRLEDLACWLAAWQGRERPRLDNIQALVFAGNHGVTARGISAFPAEVTVQMVANFQAGGAAINQVCKAAGAALQVIPLELDRPTADFTAGPAMSQQDCAAALSAGIDAVGNDADAVIVGEMGIGNTTVAAALAAACIGGAGADWVGAGTGMSEDGIALKAQVVDEALALHGQAASSAFEIMRRLGGRELAAMAGAVLGARLKRVPVVLDGFICCASAGVLHRAASDALDHCIAGHVSAEQAHRRMLEWLGKQPLLDLGMRLGEGTGAGVALGVLKAAAATHGGMATFAEAAVSGKAAESRE